ncbi:MAG TPA: alpha/beta hydrolase, partial [Actinomycetota bacterium]|nr:alpha/beta hydrolase [Actinomycetota bacterium]
RRNLEAMRVPTMVAWATDDPIISTATFQALADMVPAGPRIEFQSGGHNVQKAHAEDLAAALVEFVGG